MKKLIAFPYIGGKFSKLNGLLPLLPQTKIYCEPFCGSCSVLINKPKSQYEIANDINKQLIIFWKTLQEKPEELIRQIYLSPYARAEQLNAYYKLKDTSGLDNLEIARLFFVNTTQTTFTSGTGWGYAVTERCNPVYVALNKKVRNLYLIYERIKNVEFYSKNAEKIIKEYDSPETLFYCDPPYPNECRKVSNIYNNEMSDKEHIKLAELLHSVKARVAISCYECDLYNELYKDWNKFITYNKTIQSSASRHKKGRTMTECLWTNYQVKGGLL